MMQHGVWDGRRLQGGKLKADYILEVEDAAEAAAITSKVAKVNDGNAAEATELTQAMTSSLQTAFPEVAADLEVLGIEAPPPVTITYQVIVPKQVPPDDDDDSSVASFSSIT